MVDAEHVQKKYDIAHPAQMRDLQALMGDAAVSSFCLYMCMFIIVKSDIYKSTFKPIVRIIFLASKEWEKSPPPRF